LTPHHFSIIKRYSPNLVLAFDMDAAGNKATEKGIVLAQKMDFNIKVIPMADEKDPADIILLEGEEKWKQMIEGAKPINEFYFDLAFKNRDANSMEDRKKIMLDLLPVLKKINNAVEQSYWLEKLGNMILATEADLRTEMKKVKEESNDTYGLPEIQAKKVKDERKTKQEMLEEQTILFALKDRAQAAIPDIERINNFASPAKDVLLKIKENPQISNEILLESFKDNQLIVDYINYLILKSEISAEVEDLGEELEKCVTARDNLINKKARTELTLKIKACEAKGDFESLNVLLEEFNNLTKNKKQDEAQN
jgi:DNA primase